MREIKFRGKRVDNGEWVYGSYLKIDYHNSVDYVESHKIIMPNGHDFEVDPGTVGQFVGKKDKTKTGVEIYEGDVVKINIEDEDSCMGKRDEYICEVCFGGGEYDGSYTIKNDAFYRKHGLLSNERYEIEVTANIHDNPDLIKQKEKTDKTN